MTISNAEHTFSWGTLQLIPTSSVPEEQISSTSISKVMSVLFSDEWITLQGADGALGATTLTSFQIPVTLQGDRRLLGYKIDIHGFSHTSLNGHAVLVVNIADTTQTFTFFREQETGDFVRTFMAVEPQMVLAAPPDVRQVGGHEVLDGSEMLCISEDVEAPVVPAHLNITVLAIGDRQSLEEFVLLKVDSLDLIAIIE